MGSYPRIGSATTDAVALSFCYDWKGLICHSIRCLYRIISGDQAATLGARTKQTFPLLIWRGNKTALKEETVLYSDAMLESY